MTLVMTAVSGVTLSRGWCQSGGRRTSSKQQVGGGGGGGALCEYGCVKS
jgi:hypothetical protein